MTKQVNCKTTCDVSKLLKKAYPVFIVLYPNKTMLKKNALILKIPRDAIGILASRVFRKEEPVSDMCYLHDYISENVYETV